MSGVSNDQIYSALLEIKGDVGGLKTSVDLQLKGLENHSQRIVALEDHASKQKGAAAVWTLVATSVGALAGAVGSYFGFHR